MKGKRKLLGMMFVSYRRREDWALREVKIRAKPLWPNTFETIPY